MWKIVTAIILTSVFFVLFFEPYIRTNTVIDSKNKVSATDGFIEDTRDAFIDARDILHNYQQGMKLVN